MAVRKRAAIFSLLEARCDVANLTYGPSGDGYRFTVVPTTPSLTEQRGVYFLLSHHNDTQIQKIGLANGIRGLSQRMEGYERIYRLDRPTGDPTMALWHRMMTGLLQGETLSLWFTSLTATTAVQVLWKTMTLSWDPHPEVERVLAGEARISGQPILLSRSQAIGVQPGWLMEPPPLFFKAVAQEFLAASSSPWSSPTRASRHPGTTWVQSDRRIIGLQRCGPGCTEDQKSSAARSGANRGFPGLQQDLAARA